MGKTILFDCTGVTSPVNAITNLVTSASPGTVSAGWSVQAHFSDDSTYHGSDSTTRTYPTNAHGTTLTIALNPASLKAGAKYSVSGVLRDSKLSVTLKSMQITFVADSTITIPQTTTDNKGACSVSGLNAPSPGTYKIQAFYAGNALYKPAVSSIATLTPK